MIHFNVFWFLSPFFLWNAPLIPVKEKAISAFCLTMNNISSVKHYTTKHFTYNRGRVVLVKKHLKKIGLPCYSSIKNCTTSKYSTEFILSLSL